MEVIIHFGFPKTGSSTLQFGILKKLNNEKLINLKTWRLNDKNEHLDTRPSSRLFNKKNICNEYLEFKTDRLNVLSDESFTAPLRLRQQNYGMEIEDPKNFPIMLKNQIENKYRNENITYKCIIVLRKQSNLIYSQYVEEYNWNKYKNIDLLFDNKGKIDITGYEIYKYSSYIQILNDTYGHDNVVVALFEDMIYDLEYYCSVLAGGFRVDVGKFAHSLNSKHYNKKKKNINGVYSKDGETLVPYLTQEQEEKINSQYYESNEKLLELTSMNDKLIKYGYIK